jgi:hypothetical protein
MLDYRRRKQELAELRAVHRSTPNVRQAHRINAAILLGTGRTAADVADALLIDPDTVRTDLSSKMTKTPRKTATKET